MNITYLREAIAQHPQLWAAMGQAYRRRSHDRWACGYNDAFVAALCIVGGFDTSLVEGELEKDFGP